MSVERSSVEKDGRPVAVAVTPAADEPAEELRRLGEALNGRAKDVVAGTVARTQTSKHVLDAAVEASFERVGMASTAAVASWMAGEGLEAAREVGMETWHIFGQLAADRVAPLQEVLKRCLRWRDAAADVLRESAEELGVGAEVLSLALAALQRTLDITLIQVGEFFESERHRADEELAFMATHDALTGLPNRTLILDRVEQMLARSRRSKTLVAALFVDLDNFKAINDTLGHGVGDELLQAVAARLDGVVRAADALGRLGGDEFVVISEELSIAVGPGLIAERLLDALEQPFKLGANNETRVTVTASIGIAVSETADPADLLRDADIAMYRAKWDGKNRYVVFETSMQDKVQKHMELEMDLRDALANEEFFLAYQPTLNLSNMTPNGVEALIRWKHPVRGIVQPDDFIPLLEETGLIVEVGRWVLEQACAQCAAWRQADYPIGIAVNVSGRQLDTDQLVTDIEGALSQSDLDPGALTIEITETTLMRNVEATARRLNAVKALGVRIAIDDFGTGYSSLAHLQRFPVDALKIDRSFILGLQNNKEGETLIHTLVQLGKSLSIETFAEGIEQKEELSLLREENCDSGQGFLFACPLDVQATEAFLADWAENNSPALAQGSQHS
jgi:diguanylate cyclase (GGDEF)-like protein